MKAILVLCFLVLSVYAERVSYEGYTVFRTYPRSEEHRLLLLKLEEDSKLDFWSDVNRVGLPIDIMVSPEDQTAFLNFLRGQGMNPMVYIENVESLINNDVVGRFTPGGKMSFNQYYTLDGIYSWLDQTAAENPGLVTIVNGGSTYQGRQIKGVKIAFKPGKQIIVLECGTHAREWVSPATCNYIINDLLTSNDLTFRTIAESFEWHVFPSTNPDGYVHSHTSDRMWRKSRKPYGICTGADTNRNWDAHWAEQGASTNPCFDTFAGSSPFSEIETSSFSQYIKGIASRMAVYLSFHSYSQLILLPYGHTTTPLDNYNEMMAIGRKAIQALAGRYGTQYKIGNIAEIIYLASGGSIDWIKQEFKTPVVAAYELRDTGRYGFLLPPDQIIPNSLEVVDSLVAMLQEAEKYNYVTIG